MLRGYNPCGNGTISSSCPRIFEKKQLEDNSLLQHLKHDRYNFGVGVINNEIYVIGGVIDISNTKQTIRYCEKFNPQSPNSWIDIPEHPLLIAESLSGIWGGVIDDKFYAITTYSSKCAYYSPITNVWSFVADIPSGLGGSFMNNPTVSIYNNFMYVIGVTIDGIWRTIYYDTITDSWYQTNTTQYMPILKDMASTVITVDNTEKFYIAGGRMLDDTPNIWIREEINNVEFDDNDDAQMKHTNIIIDSHNTPHISYNDTGGLYYVYLSKQTHEWIKEVIIEDVQLGTNDNPYASEIGNFPSMAIDSNDVIHICYCMTGESPLVPSIRSLCYASRKFDGEWEFPTDPSYGVIPNAFLPRKSLRQSNAATCILIGHDDVIHILFVGTAEDGTNDYGLRYIYSIDDGISFSAPIPLSNWSFDSPFTYRGISSHFAAIASDIDNIDKIYFAYRDPSDNKLYLNNLEFNNSAVTTSTAVDISGVNCDDEHNNTCIAYQPSDSNNPSDSTIHILLQENKEILRYIKVNTSGDILQEGSSDNYKIIYSFPDPQYDMTFPSMTISSNNQIHIVYVSEYSSSITNGGNDVKFHYLKRDINGWSESTILLDDSIIGSGISSSIITDINNFPYISFYNYPASKLKYTRILPKKAYDLYEYHDGTWEKRAEMPEENYGFALVPGHDKLYAIGGANINDDSRKNIWLYDIYCNTWQKEATDDNLDVPRTNLNAISVDISGFVNQTIIIMGGYDISSNHIATNIKTMMGDPLYNICNGERSIVGDGYRDQEATTSHVVDVSGNYTVNNTPFIPPYCVLRFIIKYT